MAPKFVFFSDFDGTITLSDSNQILIDNRGFGAEKRRALDAAIIAGTLSYRDAVAQMHASVAQNIGIAACCDYLRDKVVLDQEFATFWAWCRAARGKAHGDVEVVVLSSGMEVIIHSLLDGLLGEAHYKEIRVVGNNAAEVEGKGGMDQPGGWRIQWRDDRWVVVHTQGRRPSPADFIKQPLRPRQVDRHPNVLDPPGRQAPAPVLRRRRHLRLFCRARD